MKDINVIFQLKGKQFVGKLEDEIQVPKLNLDDNKEFNINSIIAFEDNKLISKDGKPIIYDIKLIKVKDIKGEKVTKFHKLRRMCKHRKVGFTPIFSIIKIASIKAQ